MQVYYTDLIPQKSLTKFSNIPLRLAMSYTRSKYSTILKYLQNGTEMGASYTAVIVIFFNIVALDRHSASDDKQV